MTAMHHDPVLVRFARFYATIKHAGQLYGGTLPYTHHLEAVDKNVQQWFEWFPWSGVRPGDPARNAVLRAAAWLHDVQEDCGVKNRELVELFGSDIASIVDSVTDEPGDSRRVRHALTYPKIARNPAGLFIKLCDRLTNVQAGGLNVRMYHDEYEEFHRQLYRPGQYDMLWVALERALGIIPACGELAEILI